jgi:hypothetical protein
MKRSAAKAQTRRRGLIAGMAIDPYERAACEAVGVAASGDIGDIQLPWIPFFYPGRSDACMLHLANRPPASPSGAAGWCGS